MFAAALCDLNEKVGLGCLMACMAGAFICYIWGMVSQFNGLTRNGFVAIYYNLILHFSDVYSACPVASKVSMILNAVVTGLIPLGCCFSACISNKISSDEKKKDTTVPPPTAAV
jgi:fucose permease